MADWRVADSLLKLRDEVNAHYPGRSKASDGTIGDPAHQAEGSASDHNPWVKDSTGEGVVTAFDCTHDPAHGVDTYAMAERFRQARDPRLKYCISNRRIFYGGADQHGHTRWVWQTYTGTSDPHTGHMHVSVSTVQSAYDNPAPWTGVAAPTPPPPEDDMLDLTQPIPSTSTPDVPNRNLGQVLGDLWHHVQQLDPAALNALAAKVDTIGTLTLSDAQLATLAAAVVSAHPALSEDDKPVIVEAVQAALNTLHAG